MTSGLEFQISRWLTGWCGAVCFSRPLIHPHPTGDIRPLCPHGALCHMASGGAITAVNSLLALLFLGHLSCSQKSWDQITELSLTGEASISLSLVIRHAFVKTDSWFHGWREPKENERKWWEPFTAGGLKNPTYFLCPKKLSLWRTAEMKMGYPSLLHQHTESPSFHPNEKYLFWPSSEWDRNA